MQYAVRIAIVHRLPPAAHRMEFGAHEPVAARRPAPTGGAR